MTSGKCPSCEKMVTNLKMENLEARVSVAGPAYHAVSYLCPWCNVILGAGLDPFALKSDTVNKVVEQLKGRQRRS